MPIFIRKPIWTVRMDRFYPEVARTTLAAERIRRRYGSRFAVYCVAASDPAEARAIALRWGHPATCFTPERRVDIVLYRKVPVLALEGDLGAWDTAWRELTNTGAPPRFGSCPYQFGDPCRCEEGCARGVRVTC